MTSFCSRTKRALPASGPRLSPEGRHLVLALAVLVPGVAIAAGSYPVEPLHVIYETWSGAAMRSPLGIVFDRTRGEVLLANTSASRVEIYDLEGFPVGAFTHVVDGPTGDGINGFPKWMAVDSAGRILVVDQLAPYVDITDYTGRTEQRLTLPAPDDVITAGNGPGALAVTRDGRILVASRGDRGRVYEFDRSFELIRAWGDSGSAPGQLSRITGLCESPDGGVIVVSVGTDLAVQHFDPKGGFVRGHGKVDIGDGNFSFPSGVAATADGRVWVTDEIRMTLQVFDTVGAYLGVVGGAGRRPGEFLYPSAVATDGHEYLAVAERGGNRFQILQLR